MDCTDSKGVGSSALASHFAAAMQLPASAVVHSSAGEDQELKIDTSALSSSSSTSKSEPNSTTSRGVEPIFSGSAPEYLWSELLPTKEDPSGVQTSVNEERCFSLVPRIHPSELEIVKEIAQGGQAKVFLAKYLTTQQDVVVKTYRCGVNPGELRRQMESVMKACEGRSDSGLCRVIGVSVDEKGRVSTVMEPMAGDLRNFLDLKDNRLLDLDRILILRAIASGMKELHGCGFIHKDLKASNVLLSPIYMFGRMNSLTDRFMTSTHRNTEHWEKWIDRFMTSTHPYTEHWAKWIDVKIGDYESSDGVAGTGFFRAPEVLRALRDGTKVECSAAVDVYGFGMLWYELFTGELPFQGHPLSDYDLVLSGKRPDISSWETWMRTLLQRCWDEDPHRRPGWDEILQNLTEGYSRRLTII
jgi:serine/threonine protein kinase